MTPEELNRTIEFIVQSQARLAASQEQDREERLEFQKWSKKLNRQITEIIQQQNLLLDIQSRRLDEHQRESQNHQAQFNKILGEMQVWRQEQQQWQKEFQAESRKQHEETLAWLQRIVEKITDRLN